MLTPPKLEFWQCLFLRAGRVDNAPCEPARTGTLRKTSSLYFSFDIVVRERTKFLHFRVRKALPTLHFLNEIVSRISIFCQKTEETTAFSVQNSKKKSFGVIANQPEPRPCQPPCVPAFEPLDLLLVNLVRSSP